MKTDYIDKLLSVAEVICLLVVAVCISSLLTACGGGYPDVTIPPPATLRTDLRMGYFGAYDDQATQTKGAVNLWWEAHFQGDQKAIDNIITAAQPTVLMVGDQLYEQFQPTGQNYRLRADADVRLRAYLQFLRNGGALGYVKRLVPFDEPNINVRAGDFRAGIVLAQRVAAEFPELAGVGFAAIYAYKPLQYEAIELLSDVGVDDYGQKSALLTNGAYQQLVARLRPDQHTILVPGGAFGEDITPWFNFAETHQEVGSIVAFVWFNAPRPQDVGAIPGHPWVGIGFGPLRESYLAAGRLIVGSLK